jgi:hypothetical protein
MARTGRPRKEIDWLLLESLMTRNAGLNYCAERQVMRWQEEVNFKTMKAAREVIERRIQERFRMTFTEFKDQKIEPMRLSLFDKQYDMAMKGNVSLLIWLGKQMLGQSDKQDSTIKLPGLTYSDQELDARINELTQKSRLKVV